MRWRDIAAVAAIVVLGFIVFLHPAPKPGASQWESRIKAVGGIAAYQEFAQSVANLTPQKQHSAAHEFGGALYKTLGVAGLSVCDTRFSYGCYHEFLGEAIATLGLSSVTSLNEACFAALDERGLACQHGIGHGVAAYEGYTDEALLRSLAVCDTLAHNDPVGGCVGGAFMEYNMRTMLGDDGVIRPDTGNELHPCDLLAGTHKEACVFWQTQWWNISLRHPVPNAAARFAQLGARCDEFGTTFKRQCYEGVGNITTPDAKFDPAQTIVLCKATSADPQAQLFCRSAAANSLTVGGSGKVGNGEAVCAGLVGASMNFCLAYADNKANVIDVRAVPNEI